MSYPPPAEIVRAAAKFQPWMNPALEPAIIQHHEAHALCFVHLETICVPGRPHGTTTWIATTNSGRCAALIIPWALIERKQQEIVCTAHAFAIASNLYVVDSNGQQAHDHDRLKLLGALARRLQWRDVVLEELAIAQAA